MAKVNIYFKTAGNKTANQQHQGDKLNIKVLWVPELDVLFLCFYFYPNSDHQLFSVFSLIQSFFFFFDSSLIMCFQMTLQHLSLYDLTALTSYR